MSPSQHKYGWCCAASASVLLRHLSVSEARGYTGIAFLKRRSTVADAAQHQPYLIAIAEFFGFRETNDEENG